MPSMLGLTTDRSSHGIQDREEQNGNSNKQLATRQSGAVTDSRSPSRSQQDRSRSRKNRSEKDRKVGPEAKPNTILLRNQKAAVESERLLWSALCDDPEAALEYIADDALMVNPFLFGDREAKTKESEPNLKEALKDSTEYLSFKIHEPKVAEIDMMAVSIIYTATLFKETGEGKKGEQGFEAEEVAVCSVWRQVAGGDWKLVSMHAAKA